MITAFVLFVAWWLWALTWVLFMRLVARDLRKPVRTAAQLADRRAAVQIGWALGVFYTLAGAGLIWWTLAALS